MPTLFFNNAMNRNERSAMGPLSVISLVVGLQIGSALFLLPTQLVTYGFWGALSWIVTGAGAVCLSLMFSKLAEKDRAIGGPSVYVEKVFGRKAAFYVAWPYWVISWLSSLPVLSLVVSSLEFAFVPLSFFQRLALEIFILTGIAVLNLRGAAIAGIGEVIFDTMKVVPWLIIPLLCLGYWHCETLHWPAMSPIKALNEASLLTFWGFIGLEGATTLTNCVKNPERTIPWALFLGTLLVASIYFFNTVVLMGIVPAAELSTASSPYGLLLTKVFGPWAGKGLALLIAVMCLGTLNSWLLASGQIALMAGRENLFPAIFAKTNEKGSPSFGIFLTLGAMIAGLLLTKIQAAEAQLNTLINFSCSLFILIYFSCTMALIKFILDKSLTASWRFKGVIGFSLVFCLWSLTTTPWHIWLGAMLVPLSGAVMAKVWRWPVFQ